MHALQLLGSRILEIEPLAADYPQLHVVQSHYQGVRPRRPKCIDMPGLSSNSLPEHKP